MAKDKLSDKLIIEAVGSASNKRTMLNTIMTREYAIKLSYAAIVKITFPDGHWLEYECGQIINKGQNILK